LTKFKQTSILKVCDFLFQIPDFMAKVTSDKTRCALGRRNGGNN